jgi:hypothetical protein
MLRGSLVVMLRSGTIFEARHKRAEIFGADDCRSPEGVCDERDYRRS